MIRLFRNLSGGRVLSLLVLQSLLFSNLLFTHYAYAGNAYAGNADEKSVFVAAIETNKKDVAAYLGLAKVQLSLSEFDPAIKSIKSGLKYAKQRPVKLRLWATAIRIETARHKYKTARKYYRKAKSIRGSKQHPEFQLAIAKAYVQMQKFEDAHGALKLALAVDSPFQKEAQQVLLDLQMVERAIVITDSQFAYMPMVTRAELANLLVEDLAIPNKVTNKDLSEPVVGEESDQGLTDYASSQYKDQILSVHRLGLRSMKIRNGAFSPERALNRMELALLVEDVLYVKFGISRTAFIGAASPFSDLAATSTGFNAIMTAVTRGLIKGNQRGLIRPDQLVSGAEAILVLHELNSILNEQSKGD